MSTAEAQQAYADIAQDAPTFHATVALVDDAFQLALQHHRAVYDCLYLALAINQQCQLITADDAFVRQLQPTYGCLVALSSLP